MSDPPAARAFASATSLNPSAGHHVVTALGGAAIGAGVGAIAGALVGMGVPKEEAD
jgi:hypothetical protein